MTENESNKKYMDELLDSSAEGDKTTLCSLLHSHPDAFTHPEALTSLTAICTTFNKHDAKCVTCLSRVIRDSDLPYKEHLLENFEMISLLTDQGRKLGYRQG